MEAFVLEKNIEKQKHKMIDYTLLILVLILVVVGLVAVQYQCL